MTRDKTMKTQHTGRTTPGDRCYSLAVACVLFLCASLLTAATVLWIKFSILNTEFDKLQTTYSTLITEQDNLQTSYKYLTLERNRLKTKIVQMGLERDHLTVRNNNLTIICDEQKATIENLEDEIEQLQILQNMLNTIGKMRWVTFNSSFYGISNESKTWEGSRNDCKDKGADLLIINSKEEQAFIGTQLGKHQTWIGLTDTKNEKEWKWVDGKISNTTYWGDGEPNNAENEDCAAIYTSSETFWNDRKCSVELPWICEKSVS